MSSRFLCQPYTTLPACGLVYDKQLSVFHFQHIMRLLRCERPHPRHSGRGPEVMNPSSKHPFMLPIAIALTYANTNSAHVRRRPNVGGSGPLVALYVLAYRGALMGTTMTCSLLICSNTEAKKITIKLHRIAHVTTTSKIIRTASKSQCRSSSFM